jgi:hypothetical protein
LQLAPSEQILDCRIAAHKGRSGEYRLQLRCSDKHPVWNADLMGPSAAVAPGQADGAGPSRVAAVQVVGRLADYA